MDNMHFKILSKGRKLLLVEDNSIVLNILISLLKHYFFIKVAKNGQDGLKLYKEESFDIVITDIHMPKMNGIDMCKEIRKIDIEQPLVVISSSDNADDFISLIDLNIQSFIAKPFTKDKFYDKLSLVLKNIYYRKIAERQRFKEYRKHLKNKKTNSFIHTYCPLHYDRKINIKNDWGLYLHEEEDIIFLCKELEDTVVDIVFDEINSDKLNNLVYYFRKLSSLMSITDNFKDISKSFLKISNLYEEHMDSYDDPQKAESLRLIEFIWNDVEKYLYDMFIEKSVINMNYFVDSLNNNIQNIENSLNKKDTKYGDVYFF
jgi:CheY-like chemotaxis protein